MKLLRTFLHSRVSVVIATVVVIAAVVVAEVVVSEIFVDCEAVETVVVLVAIGQRKDGGDNIHRQLDRSYLFDWLNGHSHLPREVLLKY